MSNMSYCRFQNTAQDLDECLEAIQNEIFNGMPLGSRSELEGLQRILDIVEEIEYYRGDLEDYIHESIKTRSYENNH
jgi:cob(I)alamin adenosyltransferase